MATCKRIQKKNAKKTFYETCQTDGDWWEHLWDLEDEVLEEIGDTEALEISRAERKAWHEECAKIDRELEAENEN